MKNMKNLVGILALAGAVLAMPWAARAAGGDIVSIRPVNASGTDLSTPVATADDPLQSGAEIRFAMRLVKRLPTDNNWRLHHTGVNSETHDIAYNPFQIGFYVAGELRYATYDGEQMGANYTDFFFRYTVRPGDFALPAVLAVGQASPQPANSIGLREIEFHVDPKAVNYISGVTTPAWTIDNSTEAGAAATATAVLSFSQSSDVVNPDYDLRGAGFYVKTLDFDEAEETDAWRTVPAGTTRTGTIHVESAPTNTATFYVWSMDESIVKVQSSTTKNIHIASPTATETRSVAVIKLVSGQQDYTFRFEGDASAAENATTTLIFSAFDDFNYNAADNGQRVDYLQATVKVTAAPDPYMSLTDASGNNRVSIEATTDYGNYTEMRLRFSKAYDAGPVTVALKQRIGEDDVSTDDDYISNRYFSILLDPEGDPISSISLSELTMPAGETELRFYVFGLGSTANLKNPGLTLVPDVSGQSTDIQNFFAAGAALQKNGLLRITDQVPSVSVTAPANGFKNDTMNVDVTVADNWRDLSTWNTNGYRVAIKLGGQTVLDTNGVHFVEGEAQSFAVKIPLEGHPLKGVVQVWDATHGSTYSQADFDIEVEPALSATPAFYPDSDTESTPYPEGYFFSEGQSPYFRVNLTADAAEDMYAFLLPVNEAASNLVSCSACSNGLLIARGSRTSSTATLTFLDGFSSKEPMRALFRVDLRNQQQIDAEGSASLGATYDLKTVELACVNVSPTIVAGSMEMNSTPVENGGELMSRIPVGVEVKFRARVNDLSPIDLEATGDQAIVTRWQITDGATGRKSVYTRFATNENSYVTCPFTFGYEGTTQEITVWARDKDDLIERGDLDWGDPVYKFTVVVEEAPRVIISQDNGGTITEFSVEENVTRNKGFFYVQLSEQPTGYSDASLPISRNNPLVVELLTEAWGSDGFMALETNLVYFTNESSDQKVKKIYYDIDSLNGGADTLYQVSARVITSTSSNAYDQAWSDYYASSSVEITVLNIDPSIDLVKRTNGTLVEASNGTNTCSAGESIALHWKISDVLPDVTNGNMTVTWTVDAASDSPTTNPQTITNGWPYVTTGRKTSVEGDYIFNVPNSSGTMIVKMTVDDGDGGMAEREWILYVAATKRIMVNVLGPAGTGKSKYKSASGRGQGFVAAMDSATVTAESFVQTWNYAETANDAPLYAWGYPAKTTWDSYVGTTSSSYGIYVDDGKLPAAVDSSATGVALSPRGNKWAAGPYYDWSTKGGLDEEAGDYDNYFYRWMIVKTPSSGGADSSSGGSSDTVLDAAPTLWPLDMSWNVFDLADGGDKGTYGTVVVEAIFSRELYPKDNLGDINADGIPDRVVLHYGINSTEDGKMPENDLESLRNYNDDEDYLPNLAGSIYSNLIPGLPTSWTEGRKFTAFLELRGYHEGLNDAAHQIGVGNRLEPDFYSDDVEKRKAARDYSELEMLAWSLTGYDKNWTPECPSNPTLADTDEDGFADGYEYYFWYRAHVGDPEYFKQTGEYRRLTGRRYDPKNPGVGTIITSEEIERLMNPQIPYGDAASAAEVDTDNDGLPDLLEYELGTNPFDFDTDGDGLPDGWEIMIAGLDPLTAQTYADGLSDTERNTDGDAMAISSYALEKQQYPVPVNIEHAKRWTFAVIDANGDTDGVQWYAMTSAPTLAESETHEGGWQVTALVDGSVATFFTETEPTVVANGSVSRLAVATTMRTIVDYKVDSTTVEKVLGYPYLLPVGTRVSVTERTEPIKSYKIASAVAAKDANACWIYGRGTARTRLGEVAETAAEYGCLALARQLAVAADAEVVALPSDERDVAFLHFLCYQEFGFDPRTAWNPKSPLHKRWGKVTNGEAEEGVIELERGGYTGTAARTRDYANYDEFLVCSFFWNNEGMQPVCETFVSEDAPLWARIWGALTTNPQGPTDAEKTSTGHYYGRNSTNGADTDEDGVPDGWELYVMAGPKTKNGAYVFAPPYAGFVPSAGEASELPKSYFSPFVASAKESYTSNQIYLGGQDMSDGLNEFQEFAGTDTMLYYAKYSETVKHDPEDWKWYNKFFPTDPWSPDTDGDGVKDADERNAFNYATVAYDDATHGTLRVIPGGGLNPCTVDTDFDGLPDGWEKQFAGKTVYEKDGTTDETKGYVDGMDGTVEDAYTKPGDVNRDYDNDGLENWQEYLTGTMRCWRYDDPVSPLTYISSDYYFTTNGNGVATFSAEEAAKKLYADNLLDSDDVNEFWYKTLVDATSKIYNPHLVTDMGSGAQYFSRVTNVWDAAYLDANLSNGKASGAYYWFYDRIDGNKLKDVWGAAWKALFGETSLGIDSVVVAPKKYASCSPIDPDTDHDGMDDYYEVFHGMNPLLGRSGMVKDSGGYDVIYDSLYGENQNVPEAWADNSADVKNYWQVKVGLPTWTGKKPRGNGFDFEVFPWLNGLATADPDGDGLINQTEAIMLLEPQSVWLHTDPTPLWMTDSTYSNSLVRMNYRLPYRAWSIPLADESFTYEGKTYLFSDFDGYVSDLVGGVFMAFNPDAWKLVGGNNPSGWIASFEQNEGFDSDHDGIADHNEVSGKYRGKTDPINVDSPQRRQAMYFQGPERPSILQTMPFVKEEHPMAQRAGNYPDDLSFLQYTVECWVKAESLDDSTVIERAVLVGESNPDDREYVRCNFQLGIKGGKWYTKFDPNDTTRESVEVFGDDMATTAWTHLAATYDATRLVLYVNGKAVGSVDSGLQPTYGTKVVATRTPGGSYLGDVEYGYHAIILGASVKTNADGHKGRALDVTRGLGWDSYKNFFKGYIDEVRVWDGARTATEIQSTRMTRFTSADALANREAFFAEWSQGSANGDLYRGRYAKDGSGNPYALPAELRFHWSFDSLFGAANVEAVAKVPAGFKYLGENGDGDGGRALRSRPEGYGIAWWQHILAGYTGTVYSDPAWICWVPSTVAHLPRYDGTTLDSRYWSEDYEGDKAGTYKFARTAEPVSFWTQYMRGNVRVGDAEYFAMGSRHHLVAGDAMVTNSQFETLFEFTGRHLNQMGDDMLALGGAYAKHIDDLWDSQGASSNWEIAGSDEDGDGLPDWWEKLAEDLYRDDAYTGTGGIGWGSMVRWPDQNGTLMTAGEAYLRDLARGYHGDANDDPVTDDSDGDFTQRYDLDGNGIPDWWEELYGVKGEGAFDDHDNDGLCNLVEYLLSERFEIRDASGARKLFNPAKARSVLAVDPDYFFRIGSLYVGEIFADHDFIEDWWERQYKADYVSPLVYDTTTDNDDDGWSAFAEARYAQHVSPIVADGKFHYDITSGYVADHPIPTVQLKVKYNGARAADVEYSSMAVRIGRDITATKSIDASYQITGSKAVNASQSGSGVSGTPTSDTIAVSNGYKRLIGKWSDRRVYGTLTPGFIKANSIQIQVAYDPSSVIYSWSYYIGGRGPYYARGTYEEYMNAKNKYADVALMSMDDSFGYLEGIQVRTDLSSEVATISYSGFGNGKTLGTINLKTGEYDLDLGIFKDGYVMRGTNTSTVTSLEDQTFRIAYSTNPSTGIPRDLYLGEADTGRIREGLNQIMVWADLNNDGLFTVGEPFGYVRDVDIGWRRCTAEVELFDHSPILPRIDLLNPTLMDRGKSVRDYCDALIRATKEATMTESAKAYALEQLQWVYTNTWESVSLDESSLEQTRVRVVRWAVDGQPVYRLGVEPETVFDQNMLLSNRAFLTEADILAQGGFDLDWNKLKSDVVDNLGVQLYNTPVTNVAYLVMIGDGKTFWDTALDTNSVPRILDRVIERRYGFSQSATEVYSPKSEGSVVYEARPTFKWTIPGEVDSDYTGYTAFQLQILPMDSDTPVWVSGTRRLPPRDSNGRYVWTAPAYVGNDLEKSVNYRWRVSVLNAKFPTPNWRNADVGCFRMESGALSSDYGTVRACVRYFGPKAEVLDVGTVRVEAFESPDFTGDPVARAVVPASEKTAIATVDSNHVWQVELLGLPRGDYYLRAYIDSDEYGTRTVRDRWESWGYLCDRSGETDALFAPTTVTVDGGTVTTGDVPTIYIEDTDVNGNRIPDAYEMHVNGGSLDNGAIRLDETLDCGLAVKGDLLAGQLALTDYTSLVNYCSEALRLRGLVSLALGVPASTVSVDASGHIQVINRVESVKIESMSLENGRIVLKVASTTEAGNLDATAAALYGATVSSSKTVKCRVFRTETLSSADWKEVATRTISVGTAAVSVDLPESTGEAGFYRVVIEE